MKGTTKKTKLCWNCDGVVDRTAENCIYCGVYLHPESEDRVEEELGEEESSDPKTLSDHQPLYVAKEGEEEEIFYSDYKPPARSEDARGIIFPFLFLLAGSFFLLFSFILYFFSKDGVFVLRWNANYWFVYLLFSIPLLYIGWRTLQYFDEKPE